jgi:sugar phosphate permease
VTLVIWFLILIFQRDRPEDVGLPPFVADESELSRRADSDVTAGEQRSFFTILFTPTVLMMGAVYFCLKFLRYAIDSWLPYIFNAEFGLDYRSSGFYSLVFDMMGIAGGIVAGWALDKLFHGRWRSVCLVMVVGMAGCYALVSLFGRLGMLSPVLLSVLTGFVGFMLFGPDTIMSGAASVAVGGKREALAAAGIINGIGSIGSIVQELVVARLLDQYEHKIEAVNVLFLSMASVAAVLLGVLFVRARQRDRTSGDSAGGET